MNHVVGTALTPRDATMYWLSARTRNDLFLLYCFADTGRSVAELRATVANRVARIPDLLVNVLDAPANIAYPIWATCEFLDAQFVEHPLPDRGWAAVTTALADLLDTGVDAAQRPWRLHVFRGITDAPGFDQGEPALIAVLQLSHALADGRRAATIARALFTDPDDESVAGETSWPAPGLLDRFLPRGWAEAATALPKYPIAMARTVIGGIAAYRAERRLAELTSAGTIPPPAPGAPPNLLNGDGSTPRSHAVRMLVHDAESLRVPHHTVTVIAATAISLALERYLARHAAPADTLVAQVPMAVATLDAPRNSYRDLSLDLAVGEPDLSQRASRIATELAARRERAVHPLQDARTRATDAIPAAILHRDVTHYPIDFLPNRVSGHTVISSVHRGPADLTFGGPVRFTAGFPALGAVMHLTHGIHGLGDTVTLSLHADPALLPDLDTYAELLNTALAEVVSALG